VGAIVKSVLAVALLLGCAGAAHAEGVDWRAASENDVIELLTVDPDGQPRETKVWIADLDGRGYVRTNDSRWFHNFMRDPNGRIRYGGAEYPITAEVVKDAALRERVDAVFAKKYPLSMWIAGLFGRHGGDNCLALSAR
jgi:hypothetical protein